MKFNQKINQNDIVIEAINGFNNQVGECKCNCQFSIKEKNNVVNFLINPKINFDFGLFGWKLNALFFLVKEKNISINLDSFLKLCPTKYEKDIVFIIFSKLAVFNENSISFKSNPKKYEANIIYTKKFENIVKEATIIANATSFVKQLQIAPTNAMNIEKFTIAMNQKLKKINKKLKIKILKKKDLIKQKLNVLLAVCKGSNEDPSLIILEYKNNPNSNENIALVGKGIVFDAGGYSLKPSAYMVGMNQDMSGAAAVVGTIFAIAKANKKVNVVGSIPLAKNLINENSYLLHDVYKAYNGKTIEILNTDAEGRLILADAISYVSKNYKITKLLTIATLTGLSARCFGDVTTPYWSTNAKTIQLLNLAFNQSGNYCINIPLLKEYSCMVKNSSSIADLANVNLKSVHSDNSFAAAFLKEFSFCPDFTHIDIAGTIEYKKYPANQFCLILYNFVLQNFLKDN